MDKTQIWIGSQLFINKGEKTEQVRKWISQMKENGLDMIRLFMIWDHMEPKENSWDFGNYDVCFREAEKLQMHIVPTLLANSPPGWMKLTDGIQASADLDDAKLWEKSMGYVNKVVQRYYTSPALHSWILWNEPNRWIKVNQNSLKAFKEFLKRSYTEDIEALNKEYFVQYTHFDEVGEGQTADSSSQPFVGYTESLDWIRFSVHNLMEKLRDIKNEIQKVDTEHPVHVNPFEMGNCMLKVGQSIWEEAKVVDFLGCSIHPSWHSARFPQNRLHQSVAFFTDLIKSATPSKDEYFWVSELQGGTNIFSGFNYLCPSKSDIERWMWESVGAGAKGIVFWCFNARNSGFECGEWALLNQNQEPSGRLLGVKEVSNLLKENSRLFMHAKPQIPEVWILHSENTAVLGTIEGRGPEGPENPRNLQMGTDALCGAYLMCADLGLEVRMINEERLIRDGIPKGSTIIVPGATSLEYETCRALKNLAEGGVSIIADGLCGMKDRNGHSSTENKEVMDGIFGAVLEDVEAGEKGLEIGSDVYKTSIEGWFLKCTFKDVPAQNILGCYRDGSTAIVSRQYRDASSVRIGTVFFQRYLSKPDTRSLGLLKNIIGDKRKSGVQFLNPEYDFRMKVLDCPESKIILLMNSGTQREARLCVDKDGRLKCLNNGVVYEVGKEREFTVNLKAEENLIFILE